MSERDTDIEFDFFDEPETEEAPERVRLPRRPAGPGGPRGPRRVRTPAGFVPMMRLAGLVAFLIFAVIVLVFLVRGCAASGKQASYKQYMDKAQVLASNSDHIGTQLNAALTATGIKAATLEAKIRGLAAQEQQLVDQAKGITPPGPLRSEHEHLIEVLQLRQAGLSRFADALAQTANSHDATQAGQVLAAQARLLVASDVNWDFYFRDASKTVLQQQNVTGVNVPDSHTVANPDLASSQAMATVWQRLHGAATGGSPGGNHGSALVSTSALPGSKRLDPSVLNTVTASTSLAFQAAVQDSGSFQEFDVKVTLTIERNGKAIITRTQTIPIINAGETKNVTFGTLSPPIGVETTVKVDIQPVPGERTTSNNSGTYKVIFSL
jgi:outer membrane murein-binding lipoprotein Lpp